MRLPRLAAPTALLALLLLTAFAIPAQAQPTRVLVRALASGGWETLPLRAARVEVIQDGRLVGRARLGSRGIAATRLRNGVAPRNLRFVVSGGRIGKNRFGGRLVAEVRRYRWPRTVLVDTPTTLSARFHDSHRKLSGREAARRTKRFLKLPGYYRLGVDGGSNYAFDGRRFLARSGAKRYDRFVARLVRKMRDPRARRSFANRAAPKPRGASASVTPVAGGGDALGEVTEAISSGSGFFETLEKTDEVLDFADAVMSIAGIGDDAATGAQVERVSAQLQQVEQTLAIVQGQVEGVRAQGARTAYAGLVAQAEPTQAALESGLQTLKAASEMAAQYGCGETGASAEKCAEVRRLLVGAAGFVDNFREAQLGAPGAVDAYAERIAGNLVPSSEGGARGLLQGASEVMTEGPRQTLFSATDSEALQGASAYWVSSYAAALTLAPTFWALEGADPLTMENDVGQVARDAQAMQTALPDPLPPATTVDMLHGVMWPTQASAEATQQFSWMAENNPWRYAPAAESWVSADSAAASVPALTGPEAQGIPFENWFVAGTHQLEPLLESVEPAAGDSPGETILAEGEMSEEIVIPSYDGNGRGLEMEYHDFVDVANSGCQLSSERCFWPVWVGNDAIASFNYPSPTYAYTEGYFETKKFLDIEWAGQPLWGYDNDGRIYGSDPYSNIPFLFFRPLSERECYFYPPTGRLQPGSPGCA